MNQIAWLFLLTIFCIMAVSGCEPTAAPTPTEHPTMPPIEVAAEVRPVDDMVMVYVPPGVFAMGSDVEEVDSALEECRQYRTSCQWDWFTDEQPVHTVELSDGFWIDQTEVTNAQYRRCVEAEWCDAPGCWNQDDFNGPDQPVVCVTWHQAQDYCEWAGGRLPTEAEWEYAARGPEGRRYPWGDEFDGAQLNYCDATCERDWADDSFDDGYTYAAPVGSYPTGASWCGALDMAGNVWEWIEDWHDAYPTGEQTNPTGSDFGTNRVARGGAWRHDRSRARGAERSWDSPGFVSNYHGFRCVSPVSDSGD